MAKPDNDTLRILFIIALAFLSLYLYDKYKKRDLEANARYIYARFSKKSSGRKGTVFYYYFVYKGRSYKGNFKDLGTAFRKEDLLLIKFQSTDPTIHEALYNYKFMPGVKVSDLPYSGWDSFPGSIIWRNVSR